MHAGGDHSVRSEKIHQKQLLSFELLCNKEERIVEMLMFGKSHLSSDGVVGCKLT